MEDYELAEEREKQGFVEELMRRDLLEGNALGVARQYVDRGYDSLTDRQKYVLDEAVEEHRVQECDRCANDIPWSEQVNAMESGLCGWCEHMANKND